MHIVKLTIREDIYKNVMFLLSNLKISGLQIDEIHDEKSSNNTKSKIKKLFQEKKVKLFKNIEDPMLWQKKQRDEW